MRLTVKRVVLWAVLIVLTVFATGLIRNWDTIQRTMLGGVKVFETTPPVVPSDLPRPAILVFSKTNGFRHEEAIPAANALFARFARDNGWGYFQTENGATFSPQILARFDAVVFNNVSGDVFTPEQRRALKSFIEDGGGFVGIHGSGGDIKHNWTWYVDHLIGAQFKGHPMDPQFQQATVVVEDRRHPATRALPDRWQRTDEWYSFEASPRAKGYHILATLDEASYQPGSLMGTDLKMGGDDPIAWWHCIGRGPVLYSALGHRAQAYAEPAHQGMLLGATKWALGNDGKPCGSPAQPVGP